jgi:DNA polymerase I-like protein with 3'-5' exonuclease and polymerase domains
MKSKPPKLFGCAACPLGSNKEQAFVPPEIPENPNLIMVTEVPDKSPLLQKLCEKYNIRPILVSAANCCSKKLPEIEVIKACRDAYVRPILEQYPGIPVVAYGPLAASSLLGGNRKLQNLLYDAKMIDGRLVLFTHHPNFFLYTHNQSVLHHIETTTACAVRDSLVYPSFTLDWEEGLDDIFSSDEIILDVETENPPPVIDPDQKKKKQPNFIYPWVGGKLAWIGLRAGGQSYTWNVYDNYGSDLIKELCYRFAKYTGDIVGHNIKGDMVFLSYYGIRAPKARLWDTMIWYKSQAVWPTESVGLKWKAKKNFDAPAYEAEVHSLWEQKVPTSQIDFEKMRNYLAGDLLYTDMLAQEQAKEPMTYAFKLSTAYLPAITEMEINGFYVDQQVVEEEIFKNKIEQARLRSEIDETAKSAGYSDFNPQSPQQILKLLESVGIRLDATDEETLEQNAHRHPILDKLSKLRKAVKRKSTYWDTFLKWATHIAGDNGVHSQHGVQGTEGGRLNSRNPNMQNPPEGVRHCFISRYTGGKLLDTDLAALEYRLIAHASQDPTLCGMFQRKGFSTTKDKDDIHIAAAMEVYALSVEAALERRSDGKTVNYLGVYGGGYNKFLEASGLQDNKESERIFKKIKNLYPGVEEWKQTIIRRLNQTGRVINMFGRVREFEGSISQDIEREAINWAIQSAGHDILIIFTLELLDRFESEGLDKILLAAELHDELVFDAPADQWERGAKIVEEVGFDLNRIITESFGVKVSVPIFAECKVLDAWK